MNEIIVLHYYLNGNHYLEMGYTTNFEYVALELYRNWNDINLKEIIRYE